MNALDETLQEEVIKNVKDISSLVIMVTHEHKLLKFVIKNICLRK